jgi:hypothetical protein
MQESARNTNFFRFNYTVSIDLWAVYIAILVSLLFLLKVFVFEQCFGFDSNDDANHTFVNLKAARDIILTGHIPFINLYNNFGTPIIGDALTYPFSIHSITYWFFDDALAMTINRALISFLTFNFLFVFFRYFLSRFSSIICSSLVFFSPGILWNLAHHHYQMTILCVVSILIIQINYMNLKPLKFIFFIWIAYIVFLLSVSIQLVLISLPFLISFPVLIGSQKPLKFFWLNILALSSALIFITPQLFIFFEYIQNSIRNSWSPYTGILSTTREQMLSLFVPSGEWMHFGINGHFKINMYFSLVFIGLSILGLLLLIIYHKTNRRVLYTSLTLGFVPAIMAYFIQFYGTELTFFKSVDNTRVWWVSNIFIALSVGFFIDNLNQKKSSTMLAFTLFFFASILTIFYLNIKNYFPELKNISSLHDAVIVGTIVIVFTSCFLVWPVINKIKIFDNKHGFEIFRTSMISVVTILSLTPTIVSVLGFDIQSCGPGNHYFSEKNKASFEPLSVLDKMEQSNRMLSNAYPVSGYDLKAIHGNVLGSNSRSVVSSQEFKTILEKNNLIHIDDNYFFKPPWQLDRLNRLGIRYILNLARSEELEDKGWLLLPRGESDKNLHLYENPLKPTIVYLTDGNHIKYLETFYISGNGIEIVLPDIEFPQNLVITFFNRNGWEAFVDKQKKQISPNDLGMVQLSVLPNNKHVVIEYKSYTKNQFIIFYIVSIFIIFSIMLIIFFCDLKKNK